MRTGLTSRAFLRTALMFARIVLNEYFIDIPLWLTDDDKFELLSLLNLDVRILERIVSNSNSTFLLGPRSHCSELFGIPKRKC